jgi:tyrosinase
MQNHISRRKFISTTGVATAAVVGSSLFGAGSLLAVPPFVRKDIGGIAATDSIIVSYRKAVKAMQALPSTNPLSWAYQAAIHYTTLPGPPLTAWDSCEHGTYYFWSWHRMYLYWFEKIIRRMSGDYGWALPYWNWTSATERKLPVMFRDVTSELYTPNRNPSMNNGTGSLPAGDVDYSAAFSYTDFTTADDVIQGTPHGAVHVDVGGWMGSVPTAGQDPIFYLHHCNIDRLWNLWLAQGGGRTDPLGDTAWTGKTHTFFDENGAQVTMKACDVLRAALQLNYTYEGEPAQVNEYCRPILRFPWWLYQIVILWKSPLPPIELNGEVVEVSLEVKDLAARITKASETAGQRIVLQLEEIEAASQPGASWEVYVGLPKGAKPSQQSPYFVGNLVLFGNGIRDEAHHGFTPAHFSFTVKRASLAALKANGTVPLTFVPHGILIDGKPSRPKVNSPVRVGSVSIGIGSSKQQQPPKVTPGR